MWANFQQERKVDVDRQRRKSLTRQGTNTEALFFLNDRRDTIRTVSFARVKAREGIENVIISNLNNRHNIVRGGWRRRDKPRVIQC